MYKLLVLLLYLITMQCTSPNKLDEDNAYFDPVYLNNLSLDNLPAFWNGDSVTVCSFCFPSQYYNSEGHIDERFCKSGSKWLGVVVFSNPKFASTAVEARKNCCAAIFKRGDSTSGKTWWYSSSSNPANLYIIYQKYNTVIEATQYAPSIELAQDSLWKAINMIESRINHFAYSPPPIPQGKYFSIRYLEDLDLININNFWQDDSIYYWGSAGMFSDTGFLKSIEYRNSLETDITQGVHKEITVNVFKTTEFAIKALHNSKRWNQAITYYGKQDGPIKDLWYFIGDSINPSYTFICLQKLNTVINITCYPNNNEIIINTLVEIARRIDELSE
jgi:hypothetical protein